MRSIPVGTGNPYAMPAGADQSEVYPRGHGESAASEAPP